MGQPLPTARDLEEIGIDALSPIPGETEVGECVIEGPAMKLFRVGKSTIDVEDERLDTHDAAPWEVNTRLARMSSAEIVDKDSADRGSSRCSNKRLACRKRARSSALRIERALEKRGCDLRSEMYSRKAFTAPSSSAYCMRSSMMPAIANSSSSE